MARTLEIALLTGRPLSWWHRAAPTEAPGMPCVSVLLEISREEMNRRIDERVASMFAVGLVEEVKCLIGAGYGEEDPGMTSTGYREVATYLRGGGSLEEATELVRTRTRQYARRQLTWFRHQLPEPTLRLDARMPLGGQVAEVFEAWTAAQRSGDGGRDG